MQDHSRTACNIQPEPQAIDFSLVAQEQFASLLLNPPPLTEALLRAMERHGSLIVD